jgi:hypothetical protein
MPHHVFLLLVFLLMLSLAWLWHLYWVQHTSPHSKAGTIYTNIHRLRHRPVPHLIVRSVAIPPPPQRVRVHRLCVCGPGAR